MGQRARPCAVDGCRERCRLQFRVKQWWREDEVKYHTVRHPTNGLILSLRSVERGGNRLVLVSNLCPEHAEQLSRYFEKLDRVRTNINEVSPKTWVEKARGGGWGKGADWKTP